MVWLAGVLSFVLGLGLAYGGYSLLSHDWRSGALSFRFWNAEFWWAHPEYPMMGLSDNGRWVLRLAGGLAAIVAGWRLVRIAGRMD